MPIATIPLFGNALKRNIDASASGSFSKDRRMIGTFVQATNTEQLNANTVYVSKRPGFESLDTLNSGKTGSAISDDGLVSVYDNGSAVSGVYYNTTSVGTYSGVTYTVRRVSIGQEIHYVFNTCSSSGMYYLPEAIATGSSATFTANTTINDPTLTSVSSFTGLYLGQALSGTGIPANARIKSMNTGASTITMGTDDATNINATANGTGITVTRTTLAKIMAAVWTTVIPMGMVMELDGRLFVMGYTATSIARVYPSGLNNLNTWSADEYISCDSRPDLPISLSKIGNVLYGICTGHIEVLYNAGNPVGSTLSKRLPIDGIGSPAGGLVLGSFPVAQIEGKVFFLGVNAASATTGSPNGAGGIWMLAGDGIKKVSTQSIDNCLKALSGVNVGAFSRDGNVYCHVNDSTVYDLLYNVNLNLWSESGFPDGMIMSQGGDAVNSVLTAGKKYRLDVVSPSYTDDSGSYTMTIQTEPHVLNQGKAFYINSIELIADNQSSGNTGIATSGDDYATFTTARDFSMTQTRKKLWRFGLFTNHAIFKLTHSDTTAWRGQVLLVDWEPATT